RRARDADTRRLLSTRSLVTRIVVTRVLVKRPPATDEPTCWVASSRRASVAVAAAGRAAIARAGRAGVARRAAAAPRCSPAPRGAARADDVPGEVVAGEVIAEAVAGGLAGRVFGERVQRLAVDGDLLAPVGARDHPELARAGRRGRLSPAQRERLP